MAQAQPKIALHMVTQSKMPVRPQNMHTAYFLEHSRVVLLQSPLKILASAVKNRKRDRCKTKSA